MTAAVRPIGTAPPVAELIDRWEREGLVSAELARLLRADAAAYLLVTPSAGEVSGRRPTESLLTEALSYLGGGLVLAAGGLLTARLWRDLAFSGRLLLASAATALLLGAGLLVPARLGAAGGRVRRVLWVLSAAAFAGLLTLVAVDGLDIDGESAVVPMLAAGGTACYAAMLWWRERSSLQQLALLAASAVFAVFAGIQLFGDHEGLVPGLALIGLGVAWGVAGWRRLITPERTAVLAACAAALLGAAISAGGASRGWAWLLAVGVVLAVVTLAVETSNLPLLGVATVGAITILPGAVTHFFPSVVGAALVLLAAGVGLIASGLTIAGRRAKPG